MMINQLNYLLLITSMIFAISLGDSESDSDENNSVPTNSQFQLNRKQDLGVCIDDCTTQYYATAGQGVFTLKQIRTMCAEDCQKGATNSFGNNKPQKRVEAYHHPSQSMLSNVYNCEIKCMANNDKEFRSINLKKREKLCSILCGSLA